MACVGQQCDDKYNGNSKHGSYKEHLGYLHQQAIRVVDLTSIKTMQCQCGLGALNKT